MESIGKFSPKWLTVTVIIAVLVSLLLPAAQPVSAAPSTNFNLLGYSASLSGSTLKTGWTGGNLGNQWNEGDWVPYQFVITNVQASYPGLVGLPDVSIAYDYTVGSGTRFVDLARSIQIGTIQLNDTQGWPDSSGAAFLTSNITSLNVAQNSTDEAAWKLDGFKLAKYQAGWDASKQVNIPTNGSALGTTTDAMHKIVVTKEQIKAALSNLPSDTINTIVIYFQLHLSRTFVWSNALEKSYAVNGTNGWGGWLYGDPMYNNDQRNGSGFGSGSSTHVQVNMGSGGKNVPIPVPMQPTGSNYGFKYLDSNNNGQSDAGEPGLDSWTIKISTQVEGFAVSSNMTTVSSPLGQYQFNNLIAGTYNLSEELKPEWVQTAAISYQNSPPSPSTTGNITLNGNETDPVHGIDFLNVQVGTLKIVKNTVGGNGTFNFTVSGGPTAIPSQSITTTGSPSGTGSVSLQAAAGTYTVTEGSLPSGWMATPGDSAVKTIAVPPNGTGTATYSNTKLGSLVIYKTTSGGDGTFSYAVSGPNSYTSTQTITTNVAHSLTIDNLVPGTYTVTETEPPGWTSNDSSLTKTATVPAGGSVTVNYSNTKLSSLTISKAVVLEGVTANVTQDFTLSVSGPSYPTPTNHTFQLSYINGFMTAIPTWTLTDLIPGDYVVKEADPGTYWAVSGNGTITVGAGADANITVTNTHTIHLPTASFSYTPSTHLENGYPKPGALEGGRIEFLDSSTVDPAAAQWGDTIVAWHWTVNGPASGPHAGIVNKTSNSRNPYFFPPDEGAYTVTLTVTDKDGVTSSPASQVINVVNTPPKLRALNIEVRAGHDANLFARFIDHGWLDTHTAKWIVTGNIAWSQTGVVQETNQAPLATGTVTGNITWSEISTLLGSASLPAQLKGFLMLSDGNKVDGHYFVINVVPDDSSSREIDNALSNAPILTSGTVFSSYITSSTDTDVFEIKEPKSPPVFPGHTPSDAQPLTLGTEVLVTLKGLPADYDLALVAATPTTSAGTQISEFDMSEFDMSEFDMSEFDMSEFDMSEFDMSEFDMSEFDMSEFDMSKLNINEFDMSKININEFDMSEFDMSEFDMSEFDMSEFDMSPISGMSFTGLQASKIKGTDIDQSELNLDLTSLGEGFTAQVVGFSANRGTQNDVLVTNIDVPGTRLFAVIIGANGVLSTQPYSLQIETSIPRNISVPPGSPKVTGSDVTTTVTPIGPQNANPQTLFVTQTQRLQAIYGVSGNVTGLQDKLIALAGHSAVQGNIISLPSNIYDNWDINPTSIEAVNGVSANISAIIKDQLQTHPSIKYVVLVGNDDIVPYRRVIDSTTISNESLYLLSSLLKPGTPLFASVAGGYNLTDDYYVSQYPAPWMGRELYVPDIPIGRLVETPQEIIAASDVFLGRNGVLNPQTAFVSGYDFFADGSQVIANNLANAGLTTSQLITDSWTAAQLKSMVLNSNPPDVDSLNAHFTHYAAISANGFNTEQYDLLTSLDVVNASSLVGKLLLSLGCHSGLNVPDAEARSIDPGVGVDPALDFPQALAKRAVYIASTGFGLGDDQGLGGTELLMTILSKQMTQGNISVGDALVKSKQAYITGLSAMTEYDEKSTIQTALYGLPMYKIQVGATSPTPPPPPSPTTLTSSTITSTSKGQPVKNSSAKITVNSTLSPAVRATTPEYTGTINISGNTPNSVSYELYKNTTDSGNYYDANGNAQATSGRAIEPRIVQSISSDEAGSVHGIVLTGGAFTDSNGFDPVIARPTTEWEKNAVEPKTAPSYFWPADLGFVNSLQTSGGLVQSLVVIPGQFRATSAPGATVTGIQRSFTGLNFELQRSNSTDWQPPTIHEVDLMAGAGGTTDVVVDASDASGISRIVILRVGGNLISLATQPTTYAAIVDGHFTINIPALGTDRAIVQVVDRYGNVSVYTSKGPGLSFTNIVLNNQTATLGVPSELTASVPGFSGILELEPFYVWDFGDGTVTSGPVTSNTITVEHTYTGSATSRTAKVKVTDASGGIGVDSAFITINKTNTAVTVGSSANPSVYGDLVTFTAKVDPVSEPPAAEPIPTGGTVTFKDGSNTLGIAPLNASGVATFSTLSLTGGIHAINAVYGGDTYYSGASGSMNQQVSKKSAAVTIDAKTKVYGDADPELTGTLKGFLSTDNVTATYSRASGQNVGTYTITASLSPAGVLANYDITYNTASLTITPAALTITANNATKFYGQTLTFAGTEFTTSGLKYSNIVSSVTLTSAGAAANAAPATYPIIPSAAIGTGLSNYNISYVNGTLTVKDYTFGGFISPVANSQWNLGRNIPVKFTVTDGNGVPITTAVLKILVQNGGRSYQLGTASYSSSSGFYQYQLNTKGFSTGPLTITVCYSDYTPLSNASVTVEMR